MARKYTKTMLEAAANDFNKVIGFDPPIITGKETTAEQLEKDITDIVNNHLMPEDKMTQETIKLIGLMGLKMPVDEEEVETEKEEKIEKTEEEKESVVAEEAVEEKEAVKEIKKPKKEAEKSTTIKPGVIASILEFITNAPKIGINIEEIGNQLAKRFPERDAISMMKTVKAQIGGKKSPCRMEKEKKVKFKIVNGQYSI